MFDFLNDRKDVAQKNIIDFFVKKKVIVKTEKDSYRWNYVEDKNYPCNETKAQFKARLQKVEGIEKDYYFNANEEKQLWHIVYSVTDKIEFESALKTFARKFSYDEESFVESFKRFPPFKSDYGAYSEKAIKKLLPLMRLGKYWNEADFDRNTLTRIQRIINGEYDEKIKDRVRDKSIGLNEIEDFRGLPVWLACYIVYDRHSESSDFSKWKTPEDIDFYLRRFKQHSLRNPIVEQIVTESLRTVRDIWTFYSNQRDESESNNFFDEIHVELGREMKNPADKRKRIASKNIENENTNIRIRELLKELMNDTNVQDDVRPYSPSHQEILKIYEDGLFSNPNANYSMVSEDDILKIRRNSSPSSSDIKKYKLWLEQGYVSPYTGAMIPLSKLFSSEYQIEHIIPQARYFDDSMSNKIICESEVNALKGSQTAFEFLKKESGRIIELSGGRKVSLFTIEEYEGHCSLYFSKNRSKLKKLMSEEIPEGFIERQLNDSRYISKLIKSLLNNIVRDEDEKDQISHKVVPVTGQITSKLKHDWGLNDKWNEIVAPRFKRLNEITGTNQFGYFDKHINAFRCEVPDELKRNFNKKRIDHRHHALDALVIACCTREHINYLNSIESERENFSLKSRLLQKNKHDHFTKTMLLPWNGFPNDALYSLQNIVVSFKQNTRVINKTNNKFWKWIKQDNGVFKKQLVPQTKGDSWAIRKPMHKETVSGKVKVRKVKTVSFSNGIKDWQNLRDKNLKKIISGLIRDGYDIKAVSKHFKTRPYKIDNMPVSKVEVYYFTDNATATRTELNDKFTRKQLESVTDSGIKRILEEHLKKYSIDDKERFDLAFNPDGVEDLNKNIEELNHGVWHQPIYKVRVYEEGNKFAVGETGNKKSKYVESAKGTNLFFAVYWNEEKQKREYETIPLNKVIAHQKLEASLPKEERTPVPIDPLKGRFLFSLSPNDLVYVPTDEELENFVLVDFDKLSIDQRDRIYKMVSTTKAECHFVPNSNANEIMKNENGTNSKNERMQDFYNENVIIDDKNKPEMIKIRCWKLEVDRLGNITNVFR